MGCDLLVDVRFMVQVFLDFQQNAFLCVVDPIVSQNRLQHAFKGGDGELPIEFWFSLEQHLVHSELRQLLVCEINRPPIVLLLALVGSPTFAIQILRVFFNIRESAEEAVVADDQLLIFAQEHIQLNKIRELEGGKEALSRVFWGYPILLPG